jgi:hypothetical protein
MQSDNPARRRPIEALGGREFIAMMALLMALQALAIDAMLPGLGQIAADLGVSDPNRRQLVVGVFLVSAGVGALVPGAWPIAMGGARCCWSRSRSMSCSRWAARWRRISIPC